MRNGFRRFVFVGCVGGATLAPRLSHRPPGGSPSGRSGKRGHEGDDGEGVRGRIHVAHTSFEPPGRPGLESAAP